MRDGDARTVGLHAVDPTATFEVEYLTHHGTQLGPHGRVRSPIDDETSVICNQCSSRRQ